MLRTYEGTLKDNHIDWSGEAPDSKQRLMYILRYWMKKRIAGGVAAAWLRL